MILSEESQKSLDHIRFKVVRQQYDLRGVELQCLKQVFEEIQLVMVKKKVNLNTGCTGCVKTAVNVLYNFVNQHEERTIESNKQVEVKRVEAKVMDVVIDENLKATTVFREPTLAELRVMHPHIKATSVKVFLEKLEDERRGNEAR